MERNSFKEYSVLAMMSKEEQQPMNKQKAQCEASGIITYLPEYSTGMTNIGLWPSSREHFTNSTRATVNITGFERARRDLALLANVAALDIFILGKFFRCFIHTCTYNFATK